MYNTKLYLYEIIIIILILLFLNYQKNNFCKKMSFTPEKSTKQDIINLKQKYKEHIIIDYIITKDGNKLMYILYNFYKKPEWSDNIIFVCHGNKSWIGSCLTNSIIDLLKNHSILLFDYRSYGTSTGDITESGLYLDTLTIWNHIIYKKNVNVSQIVLLGNSLGTTFVSYLAYTLKKNNKELPKKLLLLSPFYNFYTISKDVLPGLGIVNNYVFPTNKFLNYIYKDINIYYIHSINDKYIDIYHSLKLNIESPGKLYKIYGTHKNLIFSNEVKNLVNKIFINNINN